MYDNCQQNDNKHNIRPPPLDSTKAAENAERELHGTPGHYVPDFGGQPEQHTFAGILFDMDGTLVDSTDAIVKHWHKWVFAFRGCYKSSSISRAFKLTSTFGESARN